MQTIAWDVDDVLNSLMRVWFEEKWLKEHADCKVRYSDIKKNPPHQILGISREEYLRSLDEFRLSAGYQNMSGTPEIKEWFLRFGYRYRHVVVTATPLIAASASSAWVLRNFGEWIRTFHFIPSKREGQAIPKYDESKAEFLKWLGNVDYFIDDSEQNLKGVEELGIKCILFPRPWNNCKSSINEQLKIMEIFK